MTQDRFSAGFELKFLAETGTFEGYASVFNVVDKVGDKIVPGAFRETLQACAKIGRFPPLLWQHEALEPIGAWREMYEDHHGLYVKGDLFIHDIAQAKEAYKLLRENVVTGLSIGYRAQESHREQKSGVRVLTKLDLLEVSLVTFPANEQARVQQIKSFTAEELPTPRELEAMLRELGFSRTQAKAIVSQGYKALTADDPEADETDEGDDLPEVLQKMHAAALEAKQHAARLRALRDLREATAAILAGRTVYDPAALKVLEYAVKYSPSQPRVPAGNSDGGQWSDEGGAGSDSSDNESSSARQTGFGIRRAPEYSMARPVSHSSKPPQVHPALRQPKSPRAASRAMTAYGETSGLAPQLKNPRSGPYNPDNWDSASDAELQRARTYIGIVSERNPRVRMAVPSDPKNPIQSRVWSRAVEATEPDNERVNLPDNITNFFLRQDGKGEQAPKRWPKTLKRQFSMGPFNNVGGGDVPRGSKTYIDFYGADK